MTAFNRSTDLPPSIATLEELKVWVDLALENLYRSKTYQELQGAFLEREMDVSVNRTADGKIRMIARSSIELDEGYIASTAGKLWTFAVPMGDAAIPAAYKVD